MIKLTATLFCFLLFLSCQSTGTGSLVKITGKEDILSTAGGDDIWDPGVLNRVKLKHAIRRYFSKTIPKNKYFFNPDYIRINLSKYNIEYAGIIDKGKKFIVCQLILYPNHISNPDVFSRHLDGGCDIVRVKYDATKDEVTYLMCNGPG